MTDDLRHPVEADHARVQAVMAEWWGGLGGEAGDTFRSALLPRLFFQHFTDTSYVLDLPDGSLGAFLVGFVSQSSPHIGYIHFVGVSPVLRRCGIGAKLYNRFFDDVRPRGVREVRSVTGIRNRQSVAFHEGLGFTVAPGDTEIDGLPVHTDYDGPGNHMITFVRQLHR